jgi:hypothetical protein
VGFEKMNCPAIVTVHSAGPGLPVGGNAAQQYFDESSTAIFRQQPGRGSERRQPALVFAGGTDSV